jgi:D-alanyl-D-alanine carboxypeptidase
LSWIVLVATLAVVAPRVAHAEALLVVEADTGKVLQAENATYPWYPASVTKLMTAYVTLKAVKEGRITLDTLLTVSPVAASQSPAKMGFRPGIQVTVDNALKMMLVRSANDMAVVLAEGVGGSIDGFSAQMSIPTACLRTVRSRRPATSRSWPAPLFTTCRNTNISSIFPRSGTAAG